MSAHRAIAVGFLCVREGPCGCCDWGGDDDGGGEARVKSFPVQ